MQKIDLIRWRGRDIPVKVQAHEEQPVGLPMVLFDDMPLDFRHAIRVWLRDVHIVGVGMPPMGNGYYLDDIEAFLASEWDKPVVQD